MIVNTMPTSKNGCGGRNGRRDESAMSSFTFWKSPPPSTLSNSNTALPLLKEVEVEEENNAAAAAALDIGGKNYSARVQVVGAATTHQQQQQKASDLQIQYANSHTLDTALAFTDVLYRGQYESSRMCETTTTSHHAF
jgi:hypothetical protein